MTQLIQDGNPDKALTRESYDAQGNLQTAEDELALVVNSVQASEDWVGSKQWNLEWRDADILFQAPRPFTTWENTYVLEPNLRRFTVATLCNSVVPQAYKGLFYEDPPFLLRARPNTKQEVIDAKRAVLGYLLSDMEFARETKWGLEQWGHQGFVVFKWGVHKKKVCIPKRKASGIPINAGPNATAQIVKDEEPQITEREKVVTRPFFEFRDCRTVLWDVKLKLPDIRMSPWVCDRRTVDYYDLQELALDPDFDLAEKIEDGEVTLKPEIMDLFFPPAETDATPAAPPAQKQALNQGPAHHGEDDDEGVDPDPLRRKLELLEWFDQRKCKVIYVLNRKKVIKSKVIKGELGYYSANYWNRPNALPGIGIGMIAGQDQRLNQGIVNSALKVLALNLNAPYLRGQDSNTPTQMIRTSLGKILTVSDIEKAYKLLETPKVDPAVWAVLAESKSTSETAVGADQLLVQGNTAGPRTSMARTAGGAGILANSSATRLEGPLDNFINQVFVPFLYQLNEIVFRFISDSEIQEIVGEKLGQAFQFDMQEFHDAKCEFDVLVGAKLAAKRTMAQSLVLLWQYGLNPEVMQILADVHQERFDVRKLLKMTLQASEWGQGIEEELIVKLTPQEIQRNQQKSEANSKMAHDAALLQQKAANDAALEDQKEQGRVANIIVKDSIKAAGLSFAEGGDAEGQGFGAPEEGVEQ